LDVHQRLSRVTVEHLDGLDCIRRYDRPGTLFFIDPPYLEVAGYEVPFPAERYAELADVLAGVSGRFLLTLNNHPQIRETFKRFAIAEISTSYSTGLNAKQRVTELLIRNR
jgi:DNA adenine methylase